MKPARGKPDRTLPTSDATERQMIESLADPAQKNLSVVERCQRLGINRSTWYGRLENPLFKARASAAYRRLCDDRLAAVMDALTQSATILGRDGFQDRRLFLELLGEYQPGMAAAAEQARKPADKMTDDELIACFEGREHMLPPGVRRRMGLDPKCPLPRKEAA